MQWRKRHTSAGFDEALVHPDDRGEVCDAVERAKAGDRAAIGELFDLFHRRVYRLARAQVGTQHDAEELVSETFVQVVRSIESFTWTGAPFWSWLRIITISRARTMYRSKGRGPEETALEAMPAPDADVRLASDENFADEGAERSRVMHLLKMLPEEHRTILVLRFYGGLTAEEIGEQIGRKPGTVRQMQMIALERLARMNSRMEDAA